MEGKTSSGMKDNPLSYWAEAMEGILIRKRIYSKNLVLPAL